jgi:hypothetical protein
MSEAESLNPELPPKRRAHDVDELPERTLQTYARLWQLETWLRRMVYVELKAKLGNNWQSVVRVDRSNGPLKADKALVHMPTPEEDPLSYAQLSELRRIITANRALFDPFLPPERIWDARMEEIAQIRHRVAHFRQGNEHDLNRVVELLRDIDKGFWKFCTSYNDTHTVLPQSDDPVTAHFLHLDLLPWSEVQPSKWARVGTIPDSEWFCVTVDTTVRPWAAWETPVSGREGIFYDVQIFTRGRRRRCFDYSQILKNTQRLHSNFAHIGLNDQAECLRLTIPALLGDRVIIPILEEVIEMAHSCAYPLGKPMLQGYIKNYADTWPEYVLAPHHALAFLTSDMPCSFFDV